MGEVDLKKFEIYSDTKIAPKNYIAIRSDGNAFHTLTKEMDLLKPFDITMRDMMVNTTKKLMNRFGAFVGYTESDEISIVIDRESDLFNRRVGKLEQISAGTCSSQFTLESNRFCTFDGRAMPFPYQEIVIEYMEDRQQDSFKNCIGSYLYWMYRLKSKMTKSKATKIMVKMDMEERTKILEEEFGIKVSEIPLWQRRGVLVYRKEVEKEGYNPVKKKKVISKRKVLDVDYKLPIFVKNKNFWDDILPVETGFKYERKAK